MGIERDQTMPKISIIIPVYKVERYLAHCIDNVLAQTFTDFECILIDDGSPDNSPAICDDYAKQDNRIKVIHKENGGVSSARNAGLDIAQGEWITFVDSDDWIECNTLETIERYTSDEQYDVICYGLKRCFEKTNIAKNVKFKEKNIFKLFARAHMYMNSPCNKFFRKKILHGLRFRPASYYGEDMEFVINIIARTQKICFLKDNLYVYRLNLQSAENNGLSDEKKIQGLIDVVNNIAHYENLGKEFQKLINYQKWVVKFRYLAYSSIRSSKKCREIYPDVNNKFFSSFLNFRKTIIALLLFLKLDAIVLFIYSKLRE